MTTEARQWVLDLVNYEMDRTDENLPDPTAGDYLADVVRFLARQLPHDDPLHHQEDCDLPENHGFPEGTPGPAESPRWEVVLSFDAGTEAEAQRIVRALAKFVEGDEHDTNVREFTLKAVEYL